MVQVSVKHAESIQIAQEECEQRLMNTPNGEDYDRLAEVYATRVLPKAGEWDLAAEFIEGNGSLSQEKKEVLVTRLKEAKETIEAQKRQKEEQEEEEEQEKERLARQKSDETLQRRASSGSNNSLRSKTHGVRSSSNDGVSPAVAAATAAVTAATTGSITQSNGSVNRSSSSSGGKSGQQVNSQNASPATGGVQHSAGKSTMSSGGNSKDSLEIVQTDPKSRGKAVRPLKNPWGIFKLFTQHLALLRGILFILAILAALSRPRTRDRLKQWAVVVWQKILQTVGMGVRVSHL